MKKRVMFVHYRTGERDGVSLEIEKRAEALRKLGCEVLFLTGYDGMKREEAIVVPEMDITSNINKFLRENFFYQKMFDEQMMIALYHNLEHQVYNKLDEIFKEYVPDLLYVHNMLSLPFSLPASTALIRALDKYQISTVAVHHDFWFERKHFLNPNYPFIKETQKLLPPNRPYILKHQVINSLAIEELYKRRKITPHQIGDYFNFSMPPQKKDSFNKDLLETFEIKENDLIALQATRIVERKAIENAIYFIHFLEKRLKQMAPVTINGKTFTKDNRIVLFMSNFIEVDSVNYFKDLKLLAEKLKVHAVWAGEKFLTTRQEKEGVKIYSFWDIYPYADFVTYPSILEGFGNQLLEAFFFKKLPVIYEYPVYEKDIKKEGYKCISFGNEYVKKNGFSLVPQQKIKDAVEETITILTHHKKLEEIVDKNFQIAESNHDEKFLIEDLKEVLKKI